MSHWPTRPLANASIGRAGSLTFSGNSTFASDRRLSVLTDYQVKMNANSTLTMNNGNLSMSINTQATPTVMPLSGLLVDSNATIQTNGTGQTTIEARGGNGPCSTFQNKGVAVVRGGKIIGGTTGTLSVTGYGYNNLSIATISGWQGQGVLVSSNVPTEGLSTITSRGANVVVTGYGANDTTANLAAISACAITNAGVVVGPPTFCTTTSLGGLITSGGNGTVTVTGYGGSLADQPVVDTSQSGNYAKPVGVIVSGANSTISSGGAGLVTVTGVGGGATANTLFGIGVAVYGSNITSGANGSVVVNGTGFQNANAAQQFGVYLTGTGCISSGAGTGNTIVTGQGGGSGGCGTGVFLQSGGTITARGSGNVTVTGTGSPSAASGNRGVSLAGAGASTPTITSNGGDVLVTGNGGNGSTGTSVSDGVSVVVNGRITAGGQGNVTVIGYGGNNNGTLGNLNTGVTLTSFGSSQMPSFITSSGGNVTVIGVGGGGKADSTPGRPMANNTGVNIACGSYITAGGTGNVTVTGQGGGRSPGATGSNNCGVYVGDGNRTAFSAGNMAYSYISSSGGKVTVTGNGGGGSGDNVNTGSGTNHGVVVDRGGMITSGGNADVNITGTGGSFGNSTSSGISNHGVLVNNATLPSGGPDYYRSTLSTGGSGNLTVNGTGGGSGSGSSNVGIVVQLGALVTAGGTTASVTLSGQGGNTTGSQNYGVQINTVTGNHPATVTSNGGNVSVTGCAPLSTAGTSQVGISMRANGTVTSGGNGSVTLIGQGGTGDTVLSGVGHTGVSVTDNARVSSGGNGAVAVNGYGGGNGARPANHGVHVTTSAVITGGANAPVTVNGFGGNANGTGTGNHGVNVTGVGSKITSSNGTVQITGIGGQTGTTVSGSGGNYGVVVESGAEASSTGTAPITVNGTGGGLGIFSAGNNHGVMIYTLGTGNTSPKITSTGGLVTVTGTAGSTNSSSSNNHGVIIGAGGLVTTTGNGTNITITGTGGGSSHPSYSNDGIWMAGHANASNYTITANGGGIFLNGTAGPSLGSVGVRACNTLPSVIGNPTTPGAVTIVTNSASLATLSGSAIHASPQLTITPRTAGVGIDLGNTLDSASGPIALSAAELAKFNAPSIQLGNAATGNVTISAQVTVPEGSNLTLLSNGTGSVFASALALTNLTMAAGKTLDVSTLPIIGTTINGTTLGTGYSQINVVGDLSIAGKTLSLSGTYTPVAGNVFTIVEATNLTGTFTGLADGSTLTFKGKTLVVNYSSTRVTLTEPSPFVTSNPTSAAVTAGSTATFTASAAGLPIPTVKWQSSTDSGSSWTDIAGATSTTYSFTAAVADNSKRYRAVFRNGFGSDANTDAATLTVNYAPSVTGHPSNTGVEAGQTASFTATANGSPTPSVQWQSSVNGTDWTDISGATSTTNSFSATTGDNGRYYRAVFTNSAGTANTNSARLVVGVTPVFTSPTAITLAEGLRSGLNVRVSGTPTPVLSVSGALPTGVTFDPSTGLLSGTAATGTAGNYPLVLQANNGVNGTVTQNFVLTVTTSVTGFDVSKGLTQRSYIRYIDLTLASSTLANTLASNLSRLQLTKSSLTGEGSSNVVIPPSVVSVVGNQIKLDFGVAGLGGSRNTSIGDGSYTLGVDLNNDGVFETKFFFFRLFGDVNGDGIVNTTDEALVTANAKSTVPYNANYDLNGDGVVNGTDLVSVRRVRGRQLGSGLLITD